MKKYLLLIVLVLLALTVNTSSDITGLLIQATSTVITIATSVIKEILSFVIKVL